MSKLWISKPFSSFLKIIFKFLFKHQPLKMLSAPGAVHLDTHRGADRRALRSAGPHMSVKQGQWRRWPRGSRRWRGHHHHDHRAKAVTLVQTTWPEELGKRLNVANGGAAELLPDGEPSPAKSRRGEELMGPGVLVWCGCAWKRGEG
jgi:hypothetical protein